MKFCGSQKSSQLWSLINLDFINQFSSWCETELYIPYIWELFWDEYVCRFLLWVICSCTKYLSFRWVVFDLCVSLQVRGLDVFSVEQRESGGLPPQRWSGQPRGQQQRWPVQWCGGGMEPRHWTELPGGTGNISTLRATENHPVRRGEDVR